MGLDWSEIVCLMEVSALHYECTYCFINMHTAFSLCTAVLPLFSSSSGTLCRVWKFVNFTFSGLRFFYRKLQVHFNQTLHAWLAITHVSERQPLAIYNLADIPGSDVTEKSSEKIFRLFINPCSTLEIHLTENHPDRIFSDNHDFRYCQSIIDPVVCMYCRALSLKMAGEL